jgi:hypothetical protein
VHLSKLGTDGLHKLFGKHFRRAKVDPPNFLVRNYRRLFGWAYGLSTLEAAMSFALGFLALALFCYYVCFRYTACCDAISDL